MIRHSGYIRFLVLLAVVIVVSSIQTAEAKHYLQCCDPDCALCPGNACCGGELGTVCSGRYGDAGILTSNPTGNPDYDDRLFCMTSMFYGGAASQTDSLTNEQLSEIVDSLTPWFAPLGFEVVYATEEVPLAVSTGMTQDTLDLERITGEADLLDIPLGYSKSPLGVPAGQYLIRLPNPGDGDIVLVLGPVEIWRELPVPTLTEWGIIIFCVLLFGWMAWVVVRRRRRVTIGV